MALMETRSVLVPPPGGPVRSGFAIAAVTAVAALATSLGIALLGPAPASSLVVVAAGGLAGFIAGRVSAGDLGVARLAEYVRTRVALRERAVNDRYLEGELRWHWRKAAEGAGIAWLVWTPMGPTVSVPLVQSVRLRPYPVLMVRLRPGQTTGDILAAEDRLRVLMGAKGIRITQVAPDVLTIELW